MPNLSLYREYPAIKSTTDRIFNVQNGTEVSNTVNDSIVGRIWQITRISVNTPHFNNPRVRKAGLKLPVNPFVFEEVMIEFPRGLFKRTQHLGQCVYHEKTISGNLVWDGTSGWYNFQLPLDAAEVLSLENQLDNKIRSRLKDQSVNLAQMIGERRQTANLLATTAVRLSTAVSALKRGNFSGAGRALGLSTSAKKNSQYKTRFEKDPSKATASGWLELQYGWVPLLSDVYGSAELLAQKAMDKTFEKVSAAVTVKKKTSSSPVAGVTVVAERTFTIRKYVWFSTSELQHTMAQIGLTNPLHLAWELMPWSFVVDWFIPVGNFLSSLDAASGLTFSSGGRTSFSRATTITYAQRKTAGAPLTSYPTCVAAPTGLIEESEGSNSSVSVVTCIRNPIFEFPGVVIPSFKNPLSMTHAANAIALLTTTFKR